MTKAEEKVLNAKMMEVDHWYETYQMYFSERVMMPENIQALVSEIKKDYGLAFDRVTGMWNF